MKPGLSKQAGFSMVAPPGVRAGPVEFKIYNLLKQFCNILKQFARFALKVKIRYGIGVS